MGPKAILILTLLCCFGTLCVEAQRDGSRRRSGRRKPTTESPPPVEEPEMENNPQKLDAETEAISKPANIQPLEAEVSAAPLSKDHNNSSGGARPSFVPRGTRKPRPMMTRGSGEGKPKPTLPSFNRKNQGRMPKPDRHEFHKTDENQLGSSSTTTTTQKPSRNNSRRRNISQASEKSGPSTMKSDSPSEASTEASPKKRFGGNRRQSSRGGSRRISTAAPEN